MKYTFNCTTEFINQTKTNLVCKGALTQEYFTIQLIVGAFVTGLAIYGLYKIKNEIVEWLNDI